MVSTGSTAACCSMVARYGFDRLNRRVLLDRRVLLSRPSVATDGMN